ncbi:hypothetical protein [Phytoactinopolyspora limicola]|uniref:hypothetical protein n=1 Tax=Phytoactinopolyspora limicola TaxID=2715536 RepID=UPI00140A3985|nr:hypothetical protein [Phytoactinopolyspora limicola]
MNDTLDVRRRRLLVAAFGLPVFGVVVAGCTTPRQAKQPAPQPAPDADARVRWRAARAEESLLIRHAATVERHPELDDVLSPLTAHHRQHLVALLGEGPLPRLATLQLTSPSDTGAAETEGSLVVDLDAVEIPNIPDKADDALGALRDAEIDTADTHTDGCLHAAGPRLATLLASIAAAEAAHHVVLETS